VGLSELTGKFKSQPPSIYLSVLAVGIVLMQYANYLKFEQPIYRGQSANIVVYFLVFLIAAVLWFGVKSHARARGWLLGFLILMSVAWVAHWFLFRLHGDAFNYTALLYVPILVMIWMKPPSVREAWVAILAFAWATTSILVLTRVLEMIGVLAIKTQSEGVIAFDEERYFLPINDLLGIDGRWPGPFGHNGDTAMMGAFLIVIALSYWTRSSYVFLAVGALTLLVTSGRASIGAVLAAIVILVMFAREGSLARIPRWIRIWGGIGALIFGAVFMYSWSAGSTGRNAFWPAFLNLWESAPLVGIGTSGIAVSGGITEQFGHAHSLYIDELARYGVLGFVTQFGAIAVGLVIAFMAAKRGMAGPLAIMTAYLVTGVTEPRNHWISPTVTGTLLILAVVTAGVSLNREKKHQDSEL
jgi:O-antigen ligase